MNLNELLSVLPEYKPKSLGSSIEVLDLVNDTRRVELGSVFVAIRGSKFDSHDLLKGVCERGPIALVLENSSKVPSDFSGIVVVVSNTREALDKLAAKFYGSPSREMFCFGVTGTNGKTSATYLFEHILGGVGASTGVLGTINHHLGSRVWEATHTTPDPLQLQKRLSEMRGEGAKAIAMEVSSHALDQHRADGVEFNTVMFTNLTHDHLDYHGSFTNYFSSKQKLFTDLLWKSLKQPKFAVVNIDDKYGRRLRVGGDAVVWTYGQSEAADFRFKILNSDFGRIDFELVSPWRKEVSFLPMCGVHNLYNAIGVVAAAASFGVSVSRALEFLTNFPGVPGRLQPVPNGRGIHLFVDYAHTPDGLENVLKSLHEIKMSGRQSSKIWTIFGCGGDRDSAKRPLMAGIAERYSDHVMVTSDNPRGEDPMAIIEQIRRGFSNEVPGKVCFQVDRRAAISDVLSRAQCHDVVLIAGKGHEDYQIIGEQRLPFSDFEVARELSR